MKKEVVLIIAGIIFQVFSSMAATWQWHVDQAITSWGFHLGSIMLTAGITAWTVRMSFTETMKKEIRQIRRELELVRRSSLEVEEGG